MRVLRSMISLSLLTVFAVAPSAGAPKVRVDWSTYGFDVQSTGYNPYETVLGVNNAGNLHLLWSVDVGGVSVTQPVLATDVMVNGTPVDLLYVGSENGGFYALSADTGQIVWQQNFGTITNSCPFFPNGIYGVTATATIDRTTNRVYVAGGRGQVFALDLATGAIASGWPVTITPAPGQEYVYSGLVLWNRVLYVALASYCDFSPYHGRVMAINTVTARRMAAFFPAGTRNGGGLWGPAAVSIDPADSNVYAATGNALTSPESYLYSDQVVRLTPSLTVLAANYPGLTGFDVDFGTEPLLYQAAGCPPQLVAINKSGVLLVYNRDTIANGPVQRIQIAAGGFAAPLIGVPAYSPATQMVYVSNPSNHTPYTHGMVALQVQADCTLALAWQQAVGPNSEDMSPPTVANGVVYFGTGSGSQVYGFNAQTGDVLWNSGTTITGDINGAGPTVVNGRLYVGSWDHRVRAFGP